MTLITRNPGTNPNQAANSIPSNTTAPTANSEKSSLISNSSTASPSFAAQIFTGFSSIVSSAFTSISNLTAVPAEKIQVEDEPPQVRAKVNSYKTLLTPAAFPIEEIRNGRAKAYNIPYYTDAQIKVVHGTKISDKTAQDTQDKILDAKQFISFLRNNYQLDDMLGHQDKFLLLATLQNLRKDLADKPHLKKQIGEQFAIIKQKLMDKIDNPQPTNECRNGFATQGKQDLVLAISQVLKQQGNTQSQIDAHLEKIQQETCDPIQAKAVIDQYAYLEINGQEENRTLWALEDINIPFSLEQENAIRKMSIE
jgi:hypothetical protein